MIDRSGWSAFGLNANPFVLSPPLDPETLVWAGNSSTKRRLDELFAAARTTPNTQVVLCRGPVGGGKTHASVYFSTEEHWPTVPDVRRVKQVRVMRLPSPKEIGKPDRDFYVDVLDHWGFDLIKAAVKRARETLTENKLAAFLRRTVVSTDLTRAILQLGSEDEDGDGADSHLIQAYFLDKCTRAELRRLGLARNIEKSQDYFRVLAGVIQCMIGITDSKDISAHTRVCLWIDEMEDFIYFAPSQYRSFGQGLRELVDRLPSYFSLFMNFTLTAPEDFEDIEVILGAYLTDRVTNHVHFNEMKKPEIRSYVEDLLASCRVQTESCVSAYHPFSDDAIEFTIDRLPKGTPRAINKQFGDLLVSAIRAGIHESSAREINVSFVQDYYSRRLNGDFL